VRGHEEQPLPQVVENLPAAEVGEPAGLEKLPGEGGGQLRLPGDRRRSHVPVQQPRQGRRERGGGQELAAPRGRRQRREGQGRAEPVEEVLQVAQEEQHRDRRHHPPATPERAPRRGVRQLRHLGHQPQQHRQGEGEVDEAVVQGQVVREREGEESGHPATPADPEERGHGERQARHVERDDQLVRREQAHGLAKGDEGDEVGRVGRDAEPALVVRGVGRGRIAELGEHVGGGEVEGQVEPGRKTRRREGREEERQQHEVSDEEAPSVGHLAALAPTPRAHEARAHPVAHRVRLADWRLLAFDVGVFHDDGRGRTRLLAVAPGRPQARRRLYTTWNRKPGRGESGHSTGRPDARSMV